MADARRRACVRCLRARACVCEDHPPWKALSRSTTAGTRSRAAVISPVTYRYIPVHTVTHRYTPLLNESLLPLPQQAAAQARSHLDDQRKDASRQEPLPATRRASAPWKAALKWSQSKGRDTLDFPAAARLPAPRPSVCGVCADAPMDPSRPSSRLSRQGTSTVLEIVDAPDWGDGHASKLITKAPSNHRFVPPTQPGHAATPLVRRRRSV